MVERELTANLGAAYEVIIGQCSPVVLEKLKNQKGYEALDRNQDSIGLLQLIKSVMFNYNNKKYRVMSIIASSVPMTQGRGVLASVYLEQFHTQFNVLRAAGGSVVSHSGIVLDELVRAVVADTSKPTADEKNLASSVPRTGIWRRSF